MDDIAGVVVVGDGWEMDGLRGEMGGGVDGGLWNGNDGMGWDEKGEEGWGRILYIFS